jgi:hypothetical protein
MMNPVANIKVDYLGAGTLRIQVKMSLVPGSKHTGSSQSHAEPDSLSRPHGVEEFHTFRCRYFHSLTVGTCVEM